MLKFRHHVPAPLRTLALTWLAVIAVGLCALAIVIVVWVAAPPSLPVSVSVGHLSQCGTRLEGSV